MAVSILQSRRLSLVNEWRLIHYCYGTFQKGRLKNVSTFTKKLSQIKNGALDLLTLNIMVYWELDLDVDCRALYREIMLLDWLAWILQNRLQNKKI